MAQESLFGGGKERPAPDDEGIRIIAPDEAAEVAEREDAAQRRGDGIPRYGDRPPAPGGPRPSLRFPLADNDDATELEPLQVAPVADDDAPDGGAGADLPHWTEPATGEVPEVVIGEVPSDRAGATSGPRWRGDVDADWDDGDDLSDLLDDASRVGALEPSDPDAPTHEEYLAFDDLDDLAEPVRRAGAPAPEPPEDVSLDDAEAETDRPPGRPAAPIVKKIGGSGRSAVPQGAATGPTSDAPSSQSSSASTDAAEGSETVRARPARRASGPVDPGVPTPGGGGRRGGGGSRGGGAEGGEGRDLGLSVAAGVMIGVLALFLFWLGANVGAFFVMVMVLPIVVLSALEYFNAVQHADYHPATLLGWVACGGMVLGAAWRGDSGIALLLALSIVFTLAWYLFDLGPGPVVQNAGVTIFGIGYVGVLGAYAGAILNLPDVGVGVLFIVAWAVTWSDVGGYVIGRKIGRTPLSAASPNKTREGLAAGIGLSVVLSLVVSRFVEPFSGNFGASFLFILVLAVIAPFGDLCESRIKRDLGIKDMGSLIPGHGGVLDRFDAMLVALPIAFYLLSVLDLV